MPLLYSHSLPLRHVSIVRVGIGENNSRRSLYLRFLLRIGHMLIQYLPCAGFIVNKRVNLKLLIKPNNIEVSILGFCYVLGTH